MFTRIEQDAIIALIRRELPLTATRAFLADRLGGQFPVTGLGVWFGTITTPNPYFTMDFGTIEDPNNLFIDFGVFT
jgi:hypothetical protein